MFKSPIPKPRARGSERSSVSRLPNAASLSIRADSPSARAVLDLQRQAGNRATAATLARYYLAKGSQIVWEDGEPPASTLRTDHLYNTKAHGEDWVYAPIPVVIKHLHDIELISTPSALLTGLMSHAAPPEMTPKGYADDATLRAVLRKLAAMSASRPDRPLTWPRVWNAVRIVCKRRAGRGHQDLPNDADEQQHWRTWKNLEEQEFEVFKEHRRKMPDRDRVRVLASLQERLTSYTFVGVHATTVENVGALIREGISAVKLDTEHHLGKGPGFYFIPARSLDKLDSVVKAASPWGPALVAVFMPTGCLAVRAREGQNVTTLEKKHDKLNCFYVFGKKEAVIPERLFHRARVVRDPTDVTMATDLRGLMPETSLEAEAYEGPLDFLTDMDVEEGYREVSAELDDAEAADDIFDWSDAYA